jgi:hypothetical protein
MLDTPARQLEYWREWSVAARVKAPMIIRIAAYACRSQAKLCCLSD